MRSLTGLAAMTLLILAVGCAGSNNDPTDSTWQLTDLEGSAPLDGSVIDLTISDGTASGSAGCNTYNTAVTLDIDSSTIAFAPEIVSTQMACDQAVMDQEQQYLGALLRVTSYQMATDTLELIDVDDIVVATFE